jgi:hypothetical protein
MLGTIGHLYIHYLRPGSRSEGAITFVRQIARRDDPSELIQTTRKLIVFQSIGLDSILAVVAHYHRLPVFNASCQAERGPIGPFRLPLPLHQPCSCDLRSFGHLNLAPWRDF